ncbi:hypothetical protein U9M48_033934 [Paspalum notatum var. saurae]|uniref:Peroxisome biogenesis protein 22 n=1 Tax=Paspalum notatum var. saurae TaxID=547442 RepID=A0AAQ3X7A9_PASNO
MPKSTYKQEDPRHQGLSKHTQNPEALDCKLRASSVRPSRLPTKKQENNARELRPPSLPFFPVVVRHLAPQTAPRTVPQIIPPSPSLAGRSRVSAVAAAAARFSSRQRRWRRPAPAAGAGAAAGGGKDDELADLVRRLVDALARYADRLPFDLDRQLTLEQLVRHKLSEGRRVTCRLLGVILEETTPEELQNHVTVRPSVVEVLLEIAKFCDVYFMERILDDESEEKVLSALTEAGLFASGSLLKDKVLFCSTENGRTSFVRQLEPDWHIDTSAEIVHQLARFIKYQLHISPQRPERIASNVFTAPSLEQYFGGLDQR